MSAGTRVLQARAELGVSIGQLFPQTQQGQGFIHNERMSQAVPLGAGGASNSLNTFWLDALNIQAAGN